MTYSDTVLQRIAPTKFKYAKAAIRENQKAASVIES